MKIHSLGRRTDLIFAKFSGIIADNENYTVIKTPSNPGYHWGNYIIFDKAPKAGDYKLWRELFDEKFPEYSEPHHYVFTWDTLEDDKGTYDEFIENGFEFDSGVVLTTGKLERPKYFNSGIKLKIIESDQQWEDVINLQVLCSDPKYINDYYMDFKRAQMENYRKMSEAARGHWFGAYLEDKLVADLGIFYEGEIARYQNVGTHPDFRRQGICATLLYLAGELALKQFKVQTLVMEADPEYHAARIYESVGFKRSEINYSLSWWRG